jgi:hypothetical protein
VILQGYNGKVDDGIDHKTYLPAAWRVDDYLDGDDDVSMDLLGSHKLLFSKAPRVGDDMARDMDRDDLEVNIVLETCLFSCWRGPTPVNRAWMLPARDWPLLLEYVECLGHTSIGGQCATTNR